MKQNAEIIPIGNESAELLKAAAEFRATWETDQKYRAVVTELRRKNTEFWNNWLREQAGTSEPVDSSWYATHQHLESGERA